MLLQMVLCQEDINAMQSFMMCQGNGQGIAASRRECDIPILYSAVP